MDKITSDVRRQQWLDIIRPVMPVPTVEEPKDDSNQYGITRGARHYGGNRS